MVFGLEITFAAWLIASLVLCVGTVVQGCIGFGGNLLAVPVVILVEPELVPGGMLIPAFVLSSLVLAREHHQTDWRGARIAIAGRVPGSVLGALLVVAISARVLSIVFGVMILIAVGLTASAAGITRTTWTLFGAGAAAGFMATSVAVGGPPIALVYQDADGPEVRTTLSAFLSVGTVISVAVLAIVGEFGLQDFRLGLSLVPATLVGVIVSGPMRSHIDGGRMRVGVLVLSSLAAVVAIIRGIAEYF